MATVLRRRFTICIPLLCATLILALPSAAAAQNGVVTGKVIDEAGGAPLEAARVVLSGTNLIETTNREGQYTFRGVAPGSYQLRVLRVGYRPATQQATVTEGQTVTLDFAMSAAPVQLDEIVSTATGEQRKLEIGNTVTTIDAAKVAEQAPITEFANLISGRAAGVQVLKSSGTTGTGTRIRIRGSNSISLSNEPLYYLDGVRLESGSSSSTLDIGGFGVDNPAGAGPSRINDINPDDIENIEIVKGPAAATLYGIQASNGVVRITTKHGTAGPPRWNLFSEIGAVSDNNTYPLNFAGRDTTADGIANGYDGFCSIQSELDGACIQTSVQSFQPLNEKATRPYKAGLRQMYGANVSGGGEQVTYFVSGSYENELGPFRLPQFEEDSIVAARGSVPDNQRRPNGLEKFGVRANVTAHASKSFDVDASLGFLTSNTRFIENDNSFLTVNGSGTASGYLPDFNRGWYFIPAELFAELATQAANRFTGGFTGNWRPTGWLTGRATVGYDVVNRTDVQFFPTGEVADYPSGPQSNRLGARSNNRFQISQTSVDLGASARFQLSPAIGSRTSVGGQFFRDLSRGAYASGRGLPAGSGTITGAQTTEARDTTLEARSIGSYVEEEVSLKQRLYLTGALRFDDNSAFGQNFDATVYPKASASWLISEEPFFHVRALNTLRFRAAYGASGQQPGTTDARRYYNAVAGKKGGVGTTGVSFGSLGNPDLKPERSREFEVGLDAGLFRDRVSVELTYYNKLTKDALVERDIAPSLGASRSQFVNLSRIRNRGFEAVLNARVIDKPSIAWDLSLSGSTTRNKILDLGAGVSPIFVGFYQRHQSGYPAGGFWAPTVSFNDANGDGIIDITEVSLSDSAVFRGSAIPTKEASLNSQLAIFSGRVVLGTQFDYRGGHLVDNSLEQFRCFAVQNCRGLYDKTAPLEEQALAQATFLPGGGNSVAFLEPGWFIKLRELSLTFEMPDRWAHAFRADRLSLTLAGRNLWTITDYSGVDPEVNAFAQDNFASSDFESQAQVRYWTARLNVGF
ncbi:MAG TPA: SusC/RagA family TonB-linked outer membrane protein [Gemmatimonadales bacterium]|jgi:TonB-linked SusC/RagA family outer membrane protein|nr:SusC/RagA family TonB-linked outer membrane protein [Gemmatimonadales bacterium]